MNIKDFKVGQTVWVKLTGNASRGKSGNDLIEEWEVVTVGKKYIYAKRKGFGFCHIEKFEKREYGYSEKIVQKTDYCVDYILYPSKKELEEEIEREELSGEISSIFRSFARKESFSLDQLRRIKAIISEQ